MDLFSDGNIKIIARLNTNKQILDILFTGKENNLRIAILTVNSKEIAAGDRLLLYELNTHTSITFHQIKTIIKLKNYYQFLHFLPDQSNIILGTPYLSRLINIFDISNYENIIHLKVTSTNHQVYKARIFVDRRWITSAALDGHSVIKKINNIDFKIILTPHHRTDIGSTKVIMNSTGDISISLGYDGSIVAMMLRNPHSQTEDLNKYEKMRNKIIKDYKHFNKIPFTKLEFESFAEPDEKLSWLEWLDQQRIKKEEEIYAEDRDALVKEFLTLKEKIKEMIDKNEQCEVAEQLPLAKFDLDWVFTNVVRHQILLLCV